MAAGSTSAAIAPGAQEFLFIKTGTFPRYIDSHVRTLTLVQRKLGLRMLSHHKVGRHSVASQAVTGGPPLKAVQAQLGHRSEQSTHRYAHLGEGSAASAHRGAATPGTRRTREHATTTWRQRCRKS